MVATMALAAPPRAAKAATDTLVRLEYQADEQGGCTSEDELRRMVADQLGHDPFRPEADRRVAVTIARTDPGFQGRIVWTEANGRRFGERLLSSRSRDCREIAANVAFAVALQLQLVDLGATNETAEAAAPSPMPQPPKAAEQTNRAPADQAPPSVSAQVPAPSPRAPPGRLVLAVGAGPAVGMGMAPAATALGRLFVVGRYRRLSAEIAADAALPVTQREPDGSGAVVTATGATAAGCGHQSILAACVLGRVGWIHARGMGVDAPSASWARFSEVGARLVAAKDSGRFVVSLHADGLVMLSQWNVVLNHTVVWTVPRVAGIVGLDVALRFF
jgi:hypothetical protein